MLLPIKICFILCHLCRQISGKMEAMNIGGQPGQWQVSWTCPSCRYHNKIAQECWTETFFYINYRRLFKFN